MRKRLILFIIFAFVAMVMLGQKEPNHNWSLDGSYDKFFGDADTSWWSRAETLRPDSVGVGAVEVWQFEATFGMPESANPPLGVAILGGFSQEILRNGWDGTMRQDYTNNSCDCTPPSREPLRYFSYFAPGVSLTTKGFRMIAFFGYGKTLKGLTTDTVNWTITPIYKAGWKVFGADVALRNKRFSLDSRAIILENDLKSAFIRLAFQPNGMFEETNWTNSRVGDDQMVGIGFYATVAYDDFSGVHAGGGAQIGLYGLVDVLGDIGVTVNPTSGATLHLGARIGLHGNTNGD